MRLRRFAPATALMLLGASAPLSAQGPSLDAPVPVDTALIRGRLDNGLTYFIRTNTRPENRAELRLVVNAGSVLEDDDQLGLAHLVEHMAFNGTEHFEKQELVDYLESIGMRFGPSINASTSFDETVYQLSVPTDDDDIVATAFQILEDWAHGVTFDPVEIDKERGVVVEEWRLGLGAGSRLRDQQFPILFRDSRYSERMPIGKKEVLETFSHEALTRFYSDWYRPELMAVIAVGDFDASHIEQLVRQHFSTLEAGADPRERTLYPVPGHTETLFAIATDPELTGTQVAVTYKQPVREGGTIGAYRQGLVQGLYDAMLNSRFFEMTQKPDAPFLFGGSGQGRLVRTSEIYQLVAAVRDGGVERGLEALLIEGERVARFGFTRGEFERQKTELLRGYEQAYAERDNLESRGYAAEYQRVFLQGESTPGIEWEYEAVQGLLPTIGLEEVNRLAREWITDRNRVVLVSAPEKEGSSVPTEEALLAVFDRVAGMDIDPYEDGVPDAPLLASPPQPGEIVRRDRIEAVDVTVWELSNGVRVLLKPTDYKDDEIVMRAFSPGGVSLAGDDIYASASMASTLVSRGGVGEFSLVDLQKVLTGKAAGVAPTINTLTEGFSGGASPKDIETLFQLVYLYFTQPRKDATAFEAFKQQIEPGIANRGANPSSHFSDTLTMVLTQDHPRSQPADLDWLAGLDLDVAYDFYRDRFADAGDFTFVFVGAFELEALEELVRTYLGALPATGRVESWRDDGMSPPTGVVKKVVRKGIEPQSRTRIIFTGPMEYTADNRMTMRFLSAALELRLREVMREDLGGTYSVSANASYQPFPTPSYSFSIGFGSDPDRVDELVAAVFAEIERMKEQGPPSGDLNKVKEADRRSAEINRQSNGWWAAQLVGSEFEGLDPSRLVRDDLGEGIGAEALREAARRWLRTDNYVQISLVPEGQGN